MNVADRGYLEENRTGWNQSVSNAWNGTILPAYGPYTPTEEELKLFGNMKDKIVLELACGNGRSLLYQAEQGAKEYYSAHRARLINHSFVIKARKRC